MAAEPQILADEACWKRIGIHGDRSCPDLAEHIHCRNCPVYHAAGRRLLDRPVPEDYRAEWTARLAEPKPVLDADALRLMLFRIADAWLALPAAHFATSLAPVPVRSVPFRSNRHFLGLINDGGELRLCFTLEHLLDLRRQSAAEDSRRAFPRLLVMQARNHLWTFPADEVQGIVRFPRSALQDPPDNLAKAPGVCTAAMLEWRGQPVGLLDVERLVDRLQEALR
ncbi:chemotaxis protein CheW [Methylogaea oryzae]|uniref:Chew domain protein n=2 Tax=Methylogaea oryzae TaxID=1295382 RepID=A0A8D4VKP9_9GAMM|nr:chemotaxis protein CheW [Methylogaea oryzae]BBL69618.1 chew domain protein [Methylogaea oryzae]